MGERQLNTHSGGGGRFEKTATLLKRYIWLFNLLATSVGLTKEEIMAAWERSPLNMSGDPLAERTFYAHRTAVEELFDVTIECKGSEGRYRVDPKSQKRHEGVQHWIVENFNFNMMLLEYKDINDRIIFEAVPSSHSPHLRDLLEAIRRNIVVQLKYYSFTREMVHELVVLPYALRLFRQRWYLVCRKKEEGSMTDFFDEEGIESSNGVMVLGLDEDRMLEVKLLEETFECPEDFDVKKFFKDCFGIIISDEDWEYVRIKATKKQAKFIRTLPLHHSQKEEPCDEEHVIFTCKVRPSFDFFQALLAMGDTIEVLSPQWVREEMAKKIDHLYHLYRGDSQVK